MHKNILKEMVFEIKFLKTFIIRFGNTNEAKVFPNKIKSFKYPTKVLIKKIVGLTVWIKCKN